jgi:cycloeucalenol cycloisomerase
MYVYGSMFYALYFLVSFPLFLRLDEGAEECWSLERATLEGLANCMAITQLLDLWRIAIGPIVDLDAARASAWAITPEHMKEQLKHQKAGVPFIY